MSKLTGEKGVEVVTVIQAPAWLRKAYAQATGKTLEQRFEELAEATLRAVLVEEVNKALVIKSRISK